MDKADLAEKVAGQVGLTKRVSNEAIDAITSVITDALAREEKVTLVGFGTFQVMERKARTGREILRQDKLFKYQLRRYLGLDRGRV